MRSWKDFKTIKGRHIIPSDANILGVSSSKICRKFRKAATSYRLEQIRGFCPTVSETYLGHLKASLFRRLKKVSKLDISYCVWQERLRPLKFVPMAKLKLRVGFHFRRSNVLTKVNGFSQGIFPIMLLLPVVLTRSPLPFTSPPFPRRVWNLLWRSKILFHPTNFLSL